MIGDAGENVFEPEEGIHSHPLTGGDEAPKHGCSPAAFITTYEDPVVAADGDAPDCAFRGVVIDSEISILAIAGECSPVLEGVAHSSAFRALREHLRLDFRQVITQLFQNGPRPLLANLTAIFRCKRLGFPFDAIELSNQQ
jgi:hypothetical protein